MALLAVDAGRSEVEVRSRKGLYVFPSVVSPATPLKNPQYIEGDLEIHMDGKKWWVGNIADREGERWRINNFGESKAHQILKVQVIAGAIYSGIASSKEIELGILVPVDSYTKEERHKLIDLLKGTYSVTYWLVKESKKEPKKKSCTIEIGENILIAQEGVAAYWSNPQEEDTQTLDFGAQTVNYCLHRFINGGSTYIEDRSGTIPDGWEILKENNPGIRVDDLAEMLAQRAIDQVHKTGWSKQRKTQVFGGVAENVFPYIKEEFPYAELADDPRNGNVDGLYNLMEEVMVHV